MSETDFPYDQRSPRNRELRAGDQDREAVAAILRREHVAGRLDTNEFDERLTRCLAAKTYAELDELIQDFPASEPDAHPRPWRARPFGVFPVLPIVPIVLALIVFSHGHLFWLAFPLVFFFIVRPLLWGRFGGWGRPRMVFANARNSSHYAGGCARGVRR